MSSKKFFIGLGSTVPSTRVLKPPGGDCSDLFGLNTRQKAQIKPLKGTSSVIDYLLRQQQPKDHHLENPALRNTSLPLITNEDMSRIKPSSKLPSPIGSDKSLNTLQSSTEFVADLPNTTKSNFAEEPSRFDSNLLSDNLDGLNIRDHNEPSNIYDGESLRPSRQSSGLSYLDSKSSDGNRQRNTSSMTLNSSVSAKKRLSANSSYASSKPSTDSGMILNNEQDKKFIRNPITGALTEVKSWNKSNRVISRMGSLQEVKTKPCRSEIITHSRVTPDETLKDARKALATRNPITGEGMPLNPFCSGGVHSRIRVIHPPGGVSSGIY